jgi:hypothetical protein
MLHFKSRNLTLWVQDEYTDANTTVFANTYPSKSPTSEEDSNEGPFDHALRNAVNGARASCSFGARTTQQIQDLQAGYSARWGFEFITLEFPFRNQVGEKEMYLCIAVKIPEKGEVASRFILHQKLYCPFNKAAIMGVYEPNEVELKKYAVKKKVNKVTIAPRPVEVPFKSNNGVMVNFPPGLTKSSPSSSALPGKHTTKRWSSKEKEADDIEEVDEAVDINVDSDAETVKE